jgi:EAL and modified HD-GYP domain-containing signal transduction protein
MGRRSSTGRFLRRRASDVATAEPQIVRQRADPWTAPAGEPLTPMSHHPGGVTYIGRAPVFDRRLDVAGFHLIVDQMDAAPEADAPDGVVSRQVLTRALLEVGLDSLIGARTGFVEVTLDMLDDGLHRALPGHRMALEVRGDVDDDAVELLRSVREAGYTLLVSDLLATSRPSEILQVAGGARIDLGSGALDEVSELRSRVAPRSKLLVCDLQSSDDVDPCRQAGATWMRGEVLRPTETIDEPTVPANRLAVLELLAELERPEVGIDDIDRLVSMDLGMSYKVLRMANSSYLALERRVERTRDAVVYLGIDTVRAVAALLALSEATDHPPEIVHISLVRAKHCEEIAKATSPHLAHAAFTTGLFSGLDLLLGLSVHQVLDRIPVSDEIAGALRDRSGRLGTILSTVMAYERHDLDALARSTLEPATIVLAYRHALTWVGRITRNL